ncbi:bifunctional isocitrate dehydrogenase kinase/phosphatase [Amphritea sp. 2_MG-2023]|uniref:bifunctional isocitrate dehydrogenase kinase/phosphatase n=1 Tax=Amphritea TaxID=515417 RepID=UPI001C073E1F|nr:MULTISPECIES: bifunctional isocitrate dehydrogenase kinase/phosphatase [Amphritea]MBU2965166.1 bifunctional isocitrate dehydrogenase kinase/phosphatase [Amphritea atlantica]MDO6418951.1 bifunctional isocitrate dehydrogenase kinase/phosphatase [Amphritea sp. 2_MG-2023]
MSQPNAEWIACLIRDGFSDYREKFETITRQAKSCFEAADWQAIQRLSAQRIDLYKVMVDRVSQQIRARVEVLSSSWWISVKACYRELMAGYQDAELGETFYNSVYCRLHNHREISDQHMFLCSHSRACEALDIDHVCRTYHLTEGLVVCLSQLMDDYRFEIPWENKRRDMRNLLRYIRRYLSDNIAVDNTVIQVVRSVFYRNKGAYIVGRVRGDNHSLPFILPVLNNESGEVYIDTVLTDENDVSIIFSFTRAYFLVAVDVPAAFIHFLHSLIPMKSIAELYSAIGFYKQGKAEFYRDYIQHLENSKDQFEIAPGTKGMVMTVFTLPSYPVVFKVIKDSFSSSKQITRHGVIAKYQLVKRHDRAGRMADTQEFINLTLPLKRFSDDLLAELLNVATSSIEVVGDQVVIKHMWTERRMIPLNIYLDEMLRQDNEQAVYLAINEFGQCIKELAAANIFAGDMLFKNFGVTRHGRVVFYDYDEILYLTECHFRYIPEPLYPEQEMAAEPWYSVSTNDVFPEEFSLLTACDKRIRKVFNELHGDLLDPGWWINIQAEVSRGAIIDLYPYRKACRFSR